MYSNRTKVQEKHKFLLHFVDIDFVWKQSNKNKFACILKPTFKTNVWREFRDATLIWQGKSLKEIALVGHCACFVHTFDMMPLKLLPSRFVNLSTILLRALIYSPSCVSPLVLLSPFIFQSSLYTASSLHYSPSSTLFHTRDKANEWFAFKWLDCVREHTQHSVNTVLAKCGHVYTYMCVALSFRTLTYWCGAILSWIATFIIM